MELPCALWEVHPNEQRRRAASIRERAAARSPWRQRIYHSKATHDRMIGVARKLVIPRALVIAPGIDSLGAIERKKRNLISRKHQARRSDRKALTKQRKCRRVIGGHINLHYATLSEK